MAQKVIEKIPSNPADEPVWIKTVSPKVETGLAYEAALFNEGTELDTALASVGSGYRSSNPGGNPHA